MDYLTELRRVSGAFLFVLLAALFISQSGRAILAAQAGVLAWKIVQVGAALIMAHFMRSQMFPYLDLEAQLAGQDPNAGRVFLGICFLTSAIILGVCQGL